MKTTLIVIGILFAVALVVFAALQFFGYLSKKWKDKDVI